MRPSCGLTTVCLTSALDHSDITGHAEPGYFGQETPCRELWAGCYLHTFLFVFLSCIALFLS